MSTEVRVASAKDGVVAWIDGTDSTPEVEISASWSPTATATEVRTALEAALDAAVERIEVKLSDR